MYQFCTKAIDIPPQDKDSYPFLLDPLFFATPYLYKASQISLLFVTFWRSHQTSFRKFIKHLKQSYKDYNVTIK